MDTENQFVIKNLLKKINEEKKITLIFTTHDKNYAASLADHVLFLNKGKLIEKSYDMSLMIEDKLKFLLPY